MTHTDEHDAQRLKPPLKGAVAYAEGAALGVVWGAIVAIYTPEMVTIGVMVLAILGMGVAYYWDRNLPTRDGGGGDNSVERVHFVEPSGLNDALEQFDAKRTEWCRCCDRTTPDDEVARLVEVETLYETVCTDCDTTAGGEVAGDA